MCKANSALLCRSKQAFQLIVSSNSVTLNLLIYSFMSRFFKSFKFAFNGLKHTLKTQPNFKAHLLAAFIVTVAAWYFQVSVAEWLALVICMALVLVAELLNTAIEIVVDICSPNFNIKAGLAKDVSAAAVLLAALASLIVGLIIFVPKIL